MFSDSSMGTSEFEIDTTEVGRILNIHPKSPAMASSKVRCPQSSEGNRPEPYLIPRPCPVMISLCMTCQMAEQPSKAQIC
ncbi:putative transcriptional regulatory protein C3C7.04 [Fusarium oxysporum f. sp. albedinis]|nr:putative transcriptional regulatory protein C3C7.04 [Fusarium oxysporum f. sp. albedinis]